MVKLLLINVGVAGLMPSPSLEKNTALRVAWEIHGQRAIELVHGITKLDIV